METNKQVAVKGGNLPSTDVSEFFGGVEMAPQDILIPKLLAMQGLSVLVADGKAVIGEFRDSVSGALKGSIDKELEVIPFFVKKGWDIQHRLPDGQFKYNRTVPVVDNMLDPAYNANWEWAGREKDPKTGADVEIKRVYRYDFFVLLPTDLANPGAMPYVLSFKATSIKAGKKLFTEAWGRAREAGLAPFSFKFKLTGKREKNEKGTFIVLDVTKGDASTEQEQAQAINWFRRIKTSAVRVDESDIDASNGADDVATVAAVNDTRF